MAKRFHYECPFVRCGESYTSPVELLDFPWCPSDLHLRKMDFITAESTSVPKHVHKKWDKRDRLKLNKEGGNWL